MKLYIVTQIQELENILQTLTKEVNELQAQPNKSQPQPQPQISITRTQLSELRKRSLSPITRSIKPRVEREHLEPINKMFKKTLHDEVLQIFEQIPKEFLFDVSKTFSKQKEKVIKELIPFIKKLLNPHIKCYDNELLKQGGKYEAHVHRQHANLRREQKIKRRKKGLQHLIKVTDPILEECQPSNIDNKTYIEDLYRAINENELQSEELSEEDEERFEIEKKKEERPERNKNNKFVIKVYNKKWRSSRIKKLLHRSEEVGKKIGTGLSRIRWRDENFVDEKSEPPTNIPEWWISNNWKKSKEEFESLENYNNYNKDHNYNNNNEAES
ncbi:hypothetical protein Glove_552g2 [Diversispora epigaea]|uniref:Uncharacterized protein n=1 Tax=Diversispora epigaea TaxID=1348612 RepID=A0A397GEU6_9GLOM|nr:hypothetical protein Glove_552g2 [Diversispora epigaea]